jgi:hypothetical protein
MPWIGERAGVEFAEDRVAIAGNKVVEGVAKGAREEVPERTANAPGASEFTEDVGDSIGAGDELFVRFLGPHYDVKRVEILGAGSVALEDASGEGALERGEAEEIVAIVAEGELDESVAESADAVVEEDGVRGHTIPS